MPRPAPDRASYCSYAAFSDPDGNMWLLKEVTTRLPGRTGQRDENWPRWYAAYMVAEQVGKELPQ